MGTQSKNRAAREEMQQRVLECLREGMTIHETAAYLKTTRNNIYGWRTREEKFRYAMIAAQETGKRKRVALEHVYPKGVGPVPEDSDLPEELDDWKKEFIKRFTREKGVKTRACKETGVTLRALNKALKEDEIFRREMELAKQEVADAFEDEAKRRALEGNATMLSKVLASMRPEKWGGKISVEHKVKSFEPSAVEEDLAMQMVAEIVEGEVLDSGDAQGAEDATGQPKSLLASSGESKAAGQAEAPNEELGKE